MSSHITVLPSEILLQILKHLPTSGKYRMLCMCKSLYEITLTTLYEVIWLEADIASSISPPYHLLLEQFLRPPEHASLVRKVIFLGPRSEIYMWPLDPYESPPNGHPQIIARRLVQDLALASPPILDRAVSDEYAAEHSIADWERDEDEDPWDYAIRYGEIDAYQALLLSQLHHLRSFTIGYHSEVGFPFLSIVIRNALRCEDSINLNAFKYLQTVELFVPVENLTPAMCHFGIRNSLEISSFLYLPSLCQFTALFVDDPGYFTWPSQPPSATALMSLHLQKSHLKPKDLRTLLTVAPNLKHLDYEFLCRDKDFNCEMLDKALVPVAISLENLTFSIHLYVLEALNPHDADSSLGIRGRLESLATFDRLKILTLPFIVLLGSHPDPFTCNLASRLPQTLTSLKVTNKNEVFRPFSARKRAALGCLRDYVDAYLDGPRCRLERLVLTLEDTLNSWNDPMQYFLRETCESFGVEYRIQRT